MFKGERMNALLVSLSLLTANGKEEVKVNVQQAIPVMAPALVVAKKDAEASLLTKIAITVGAAALVGSLAGSMLYDNVHVHINS
jgi:hypothetical protein